MPTTNQDFTTALESAVASCCHSCPDGTLMLGNATPLLEVAFAVAVVASSSERFRRSLTTLIEPIWLATYNSYFEPGSTSYRVLRYIRTYLDRYDIRAKRTVDRSLRVRVEGDDGQPRDLSVSFTELVPGSLPLEGQVRIASLVLSAASLAALILATTSPHTCVPSYYLLLLLAPYLMLFTLHFALQLLILAVVLVMRTHSRFRWFFESRREHKRLKDLQAKIDEREKRRKNDRS